jgi:hypothetical protein
MRLSFRLPAWTIGRGGGRKLFRLLSGFHGVGLEGALQDVVPIGAYHPRTIRIARYRVVPPHGDLLYTYVAQERPSVWFIVSSKFT